MTGPIRAMRFSSGPGVANYSLVAAELVDPAQDIQAYQVEIEDLRASLVERDETIAAQQDMVAARDLRIRELVQRLTELNNQLWMLQTKGEPR